MMLWKFIPLSLFSATYCVAFIDLFWDLPPLSINKEYLFVGEHLTVTCLLSENQLRQGLTADSVSFRRETLDQQKQPFCFNSSDVVIVNNMIAILNVSVDPQMAGTYYCYDTPDCDGNCIGVTRDIHVEYSPQPVTNFYCVVHNFDDSMTCTWNYPVAYMDEHNVNTTVKYSIGNGTPPVPKQCQRYGCVWKPFSFAATRYEVLVTVTNSKNYASVESIFVVDPYTIVKPSPVIDLVCNASSNELGCLHLEWSHSKIHWTQYYRIQVHVLDHCAKCNNSFEVFQDHVTQRTYDVCRFPAYSHLNVSVEVHPGGQYNGSWSDPAFCNNWTPQEAPDVGPSITPGSFILHASPHSNDFNVTFYWNEVPISLKHGIIDSYKLMVKGEQKIVPVPSPSEPQRLLTTTIRMSGEDKTPFDVNLYAHNLAGWSRRPSTWFVNPLASEVPYDLRNSFVGKILDSGLTLSWDLGKNSSLYKVTVYWCYSPSQTIGNCLTSLHWETAIDGSTKQYTIPHLQYNYISYSYGLSVAKVYSHESSEIFWTKCLKIHNARPSHITFFVNPLDESARVTWVRHNCSYASRSGYVVKQYIVQYCVKSECGDGNRIKSESISPSKSSHVIANITSGTEYMVSMLIITDEDIRSSDVEWKKTVPYKLNPGGSKLDPALITGIVIGVVVFVTGIVIVVFCVCRFREREKELMGDLEKGSDIIDKHILSESVSSSLSSTDQNDCSGSSGTTQVTLASNMTEGNEEDRNDAVPLVPTAPSPQIYNDADDCTSNTTNPLSNQPMGQSNVSRNLEEEGGLAGAANLGFVESLDIEQSANSLNSEQNDISAYQKIIPDLHHIHGHSETLNTFECELSTFSTQTTPEPHKTQKLQVQDQSSAPLQIMFSPSSAGENSNMVVMSVNEAPQSNTQPVEASITYGDYISDPSASNSTSGGENMEELISHSPSSNTGFSSESSSPGNTSYFTITAMPERGSGAFEMLAVGDDDDNPYIGNGTTGPFYYCLGNNDDHIRQQQCREPTTEQEQTSGVSDDGSVSKRVPLNANEANCLQNTRNDPRGYDTSCGNPQEDHDRSMLNGAMAEIDAYTHFAHPAWRETENTSDIGQSFSSLDSDGNECPLLGISATDASNQPTNKDTFVKTTDFTNDDGNFPEPSSHKTIELPNLQTPGSNFAQNNFDSTKGRNNTLLTPSSHPSIELSSLHDLPSSHSDRCRQTTRQYDESLADAINASLVEDNNVHDFKQSSQHINLAADEILAVGDSQVQIEASDDKLGYVFSPPPPTQPKNTRDTSC